MCAYMYACRLALPILPILEGPDSTTDLSTGILKCFISDQSVPPFRLSGGPALRNSLYHCQT